MGTGGAIFYTCLDLYDGKGQQYLKETECIEGACKDNAGVEGNTSSVIDLKSDETCRLYIDAANKFVDNLSSNDEFSPDGTVSKGEMRECSLAVWFPMVFGDFLYLWCLPWFWGFSAPGAFFDVSLLALS